MSVVRAAIAGVRGAVGTAMALGAEGVATLRLWWHDLSAAERVLYRAMLLLAIGAGGIDWRLAFIVPGALFALVFFGFSLGRTASATDDQTPQEG